ncbi:MAG: hypothetical protein IJN54_11415 [Lachnospiraceae bacterium]|nr:hypothetical protein [Lachnospiraceae bacterium]
MQPQILMYHISDCNSNDKRLSTYIDYLNHDGKKYRAEYNNSTFLIWEYNFPENAILSDHIEYIEANSGGRKWICIYNEKKKMFIHTSADSAKEVRCSKTIHYETWDRTGFWCYFPNWYDNNQRPFLVQATTFEDYKKQLKMYKDTDATNNIASDIALNSNEQKLNDYMDTLRQTIINNKYVKTIREEVPKPKYYPPIHPFYDAKSKLLENQNTPEYKLFDIFKNMPKGGNLHIHTSATLSVESLMELLELFDNNDDLISGQGQHTWAVYVLMQDLPEKNAIKNTLYLIDNKEQSINPSDQYKKFSTLTDDEKADLMSDLCFMDDNKFKQIEYIWDAFNQAFTRVSTILKVKTFYYEYYIRSFEELVNDNVDYVELRCGTPNFVANNNDLFVSNSHHPNANAEGTNLLASDTYPYQVIYDSYQAVKKSHPTFKLKLIIAGNRSKNADFIKEEIQKVNTWIQNPPEDIETNFIIGYDLVGEEDRGNETNIYAESLYASGCVGAVPFYFHDGESCWANDDNIYSAFTLGSRRIGHGLNLFRFPAMVDLMKDKGVALEVCPISNQLLRYTTDLRMHPIGEYLNRGIPCVICSDDPLILGNPGLSYDFWEMYLGQLLDLREIKKLILNSYQYSGMTEHEKVEKINAWEEKWNMFIN